MGNSTAAPAIAALVACAFACFVVPAPAQEVDAEEPSALPEWGIFNDLLGTWVNGEGITLSFEWSPDRSEIITRAANENGARYQLRSESRTFQRIGTDGFKSVAKERRDGSLSVPTSISTSWVGDVLNDNLFRQTFGNGDISIWERRQGSNKSVARDITSFPYNDKFGLLAQLAGGYYWSDSNSNLLTFRWVDPGQHLVSEYRKPGLDAVGEAHYFYDAKVNQIRTYILDMTATSLIDKSSLAFKSKDMATLHIVLLPDGSIDWNTDEVKGFFGVPASYNHYRQVSGDEVAGLLQIAQQKADEIEHEQRMERRKIWNAVFQTAASVLSESAEYYAEQAEQSQAALRATIANAEMMARRITEEESTRKSDASTSDASRLPPRSYMQQAATGVGQSLHQDGSGTEGANIEQLGKHQGRQAEGDIQAAVRAEQERVSAAKRREVERVKREEDRRRQKELARQKQQQALQDHLAAERRGIQLRALKCPGIGNQIVGSRPRVTSRIANCIAVQFEARCPGTQPGQGVGGNFYNFIGSTGNISCANDTIDLPAGLSCPVEQVVVDVRDVTVCQ